MEDTFVQIISQVGFPIFVAVYMLFKGSKDQAATSTALASLETAIVKLTERIEINGK